MGSVLQEEAFSKLKGKFTWKAPSAENGQQTVEASSSQGAAASSVAQMKTPLWMATQKGFKVDGFCNEAGSPHVFRIKKLTEEEATLVKHAFGLDHGEDVTIEIRKLLTDLKVHNNKLQSIVTYASSNLASSSKAWLEDVVLHGAHVALRQRTLRTKSIDIAKHITILRDPIAVRVNKNFTAGGISIHRGFRNFRARHSARYHIFQAALQGSQGYMVCEDLFEFIGVLCCSFSCTDTHTLTCEVTTQDVVSNGSSQRLAECLKSLEIMVFTWARCMGCTFTYILTTFFPRPRSSVQRGKRLRLTLTMRRDLVNLSFRRSGLCLKLKTKRR